MAVRTGSTSGLLNFVPSTCFETYILARLAASGVLPQTG
ncbi:hypothetical protein ANH9381_0906 [Aggregatibacter actinomycetemcomitans ANH9381]|nr:hypothetical protein ANH9381_0906 [Aggregatibacter actinomycetemcomitans ANH9381]